MKQDYQSFLAIPEGKLLPCGYDGEMNESWAMRYESNRWANIAYSFGCHECGSEWTADGDFIPLYYL